MAGRRYLHSYVHILYFSTLRLQIATFMSKMGESLPLPPYKEELVYICNPQ